MLPELLFPKFCLGCNKLGIYICPSCQKKLQYSNDSFQELPGIKSSLSIYRYNPFFKKIIKTIKYRLATSVLQELFLIIPPEALYKLQLYKTLPDNFVLQPIPLHPQRLKERGFNQAVFIARFFQLYLDIPIIDTLERNKHTSPQAQIQSFKDRWNNLRNAFTLKPSSSIHGKNIILVDDVATSGATMAAAAFVLKQSGARTVHTLTLAHG